MWKNEMTSSEDKGICEWGEMGILQLVYKLDDEWE